MRDQSNISTLHHTKRKKRVEFNVPGRIATPIAVYTYLIDQMIETSSFVPCQSLFIHTHWYSDKITKINLISVCIVESSY